MRFGRVVAAVVGSLLLLIGGALLLGGLALGIGYVVGRDDAGFVDSGWERFDARGVALTSDDVAFEVDPGTSGWLLDLVDLDVRLRARCAPDPCDLFVGIARAVDVEAYLDGVARSEVDAFVDGGPVVTEIDGASTAAPPADQAIWVVSSSGSGELDVEWEAAAGDWIAVVMPTDATAGFSADVNAGVKSGLIVPFAIAGLVLGLLVFGAGVALIIMATGSDDADPGARDDDRGGPGPGGERTLDRDTSPFPPPVVAGAATESTAGPVRLNARLDAPLSRWRWLVKPILVIPHVIVLAFLWVAFVATTFVAGASILFTGRYPIGIFRLNLGVLRWSWRVAYYASTGGIGTDRYPPFSLGAHPDYPATLDVDRPGELSRGLVLVKWLLAIPHYLLLALVLGSLGWMTDVGVVEFWVGGSLLGMLVLVAGLMLLFTGHYPGALFDIIIGVNRWLFRVVVYVALMTDEYPPFRFDQGGREPDSTLHPTPARPRTI